jgi:hypothetical protein
MSVMVQNSGDDHFEPGLQVDGVGSTLSAAGEVPGEPAQTTHPTEPGRSFHAHYISSAGWPPTSAVEDGEYFQDVTDDTVDKQVWGACYDKLAGTPQSSAPTELRVLT